MKKVIFSFDDKFAKKLKNKKYILGGKGANLGEMGRLGLPVPPGFTISTNVCDIFYKNKKRLPKKIILDIEEELKKIEKSTKKKFFKKYQVNSIVMKNASKDAIFMHCLPANRDQEVSSELIDSNRSVVWKQAQNRMFVQQAIILDLI